MLRKKPPIAQVLVSDAFFRYFVVLSANEDVKSLLGLKIDCLLHAEGGGFKNVRRPN